MVKKKRLKDSVWLSPLVWLFVGLLIGTAIGYTFYQTDIAAYLPQPTQSSPTSATSVVHLIAIPDWGGPGYDAFILSSSANGTVPTPATKAGPGSNDNNITVPVGRPVTFVITDIDTAINLNYTENATIPFTIYNDTSNGQVPVHYSVGQLVQIPVSHTFTVTGTDVNIPLPPDTIVSFTTTFAKPGVYMYFCTAPCGPGMDFIGYMEGFIIVT